jgi:hypothetical protein
MESDYLDENVRAQRNLVAEEVNLGHRISFWANKSLFKLFVSPWSFLAGMFTPTGVEKVPLGVCPGKNINDMHALCEQAETRESIDVSDIQDSKWKLLFYISIVVWALFKALHDIFLLLDYGEFVTIAMGQVSAFAHGIAVCALFVWSIPLFAVFVAPSGEDTECSCFYRLPALAGVFALAAPMSFLVLFVSKVQCLGMSILYGDYFYFTRFDVPYYLVKQSKMWSWSTLVVPWLAGTPDFKEEDHPSPSAVIVSRRQASVLPRDFGYDELKSYYYLSGAQYILAVFRFFVWNVPVCLATSAATLRSEILLTEFMRKNTDPFRHVLLQIIVCLPSVFTIVFMIAYLKKFASEDLPEYLHMYRHHIILRCLAGMKMEHRFSLVFWATTVCWGFMSCTTAYGLAPDLGVLLPWIDKSPEMPHLWVAELWVASGFTFMFLPVQLMVSDTFACREDLMKLEKILEYLRNSDKTGIRKRHNRLRPHMDSRDIDGLGYEVDGTGNTIFKLGKDLTSVMRRRQIIAL